MKFVLLVIFFIFQNSFAARTPSRWRMEFNYGEVTTDYYEFLQGVGETTVEQRSDWGEVIYQYYLFPPWLDIAASANYTGFKIKRPEDKTRQIKILTGLLDFGFVLPAFSEYFLLKLNAERFYTTTYVEGDAFGFQDLVGWQVYPELEWLAFGSDAFMQINTFFKIPLFTDNGNRREFTAGLKLRIPFFGGKQRFPVYAYKSAIILKFFYTNLKVDFEDASRLSGNVAMEQYGASIGINF